MVVGGTEKVVGFGNDGGRVGFGTEGCALMIP